MKKHCYVPEEPILKETIVSASALIQPVLLFFTYIQEKSIIWELGLFFYVYYEIKACLSHFIWVPRSQWQWKTFVKRNKRIYISYFITGSIVFLHILKIKRRQFEIFLYGIP